MGIYYVSGIPFGDELYHHGIKGQKWGIRRFQNPDGSLTAEGLKKARLNMKDARADLGFGDKGHLNSTQKSLMRSYKSYANAAIRAGRKGDASITKRKDPTRHYNKGFDYMKSAAAFKSMAKKYSSLSTTEQKSINRGMHIARGLGLFVAGGLGAGIGNEIYKNELSKRLGS